MKAAEGNLPGPATWAAVVVARSSALSARPARIFPPSTRIPPRSLRFAKGVGAGTIGSAMAGFLPGAARRALPAVRVGTILGMPGDVCADTRL